MKEKRRISVVNIYIGIFAIGLAFVYYINEQAIVIPSRVGTSLVFSETDNPILFWLFIILLGGMGAFFIINELKKLLRKDEEKTI